MTQKKFVFRQLSRYICTRRIQFLLQNIHVVSFSDNDDVICCFVGSRLSFISVIQGMNIVKISNKNLHLQNDTDVYHGKAATVIQPILIRFYVMFIFT